jgi:hypothetical protein
MKSTDAYFSDLKAARVSKTPVNGSSETHEAPMSRTALLTLVSVGAIGLVLPTAAYFWFLHQYAVNVPYWDQWSDVSLLGHWYSGTLSVGTLWAPHFDHRMLFPNLIVLALALSTHFSITFEEYLSGALLVAAVGLFILAHKRRSPSTPLIYYCPVALLLFSFVQFQNTLWGFQMAWYLVMLALATALFLLDRPTLNGFVLAGAIAAAVVGSFSSLQGLLIWPVGLVLLLQRRRSHRLVLAWVVSAVMAGGVYFYHLQYFGSSDRFYVFAHPVATLKFFFFTIGAVVGNPATNPATNPSGLTILLGVIIFSVAVWVVIAYGLRRDGASGSPIGVALTCFGLLFAAVITQGRAWFWFFPYQPRYTTYDLLILVGCYLALLDRIVFRLSPQRSPKVSLPATGTDLPGRLAGQTLNTQDPEAQRGSLTQAVVGTVLMSAICLQVILGTSNGLTSAKSWSENQKVVADITVNAHQASDTLIRELVNNAVQSRQLVMVMRSHHLSLFATHAQVQYSRAGLFPDLTELRTRILIPVDGGKLEGTKVLDAAASDTSGVTNVDFRLGDREMHSMLVATATRTAYGWIADWNTTSVANGTYNLQSIAYGPDGRTSYSSAITITIRN